MKAKILTLVLFAVFVTDAFAQSKDFLYVRQIDGKITSISLDNLQKITFTDDNIIMQQIDNDALSFTYADVSKFTFEDQGYTVIAPLAETTGDKIYYNSESESVILSSNIPIGDVRIYNLQGVLLKHTVEQHLTGDISISSLPAGLYIVKTGASVKKIFKH
jgi:hypothetical protein